jgi:hypothetical protein
VTDNATKAPERSKPVSLTEQGVIEPKAGEVMDASPFGEIRSWDDGNDMGVLWEDLRDIFKVRVKFADASNLPDASTVKLQYWRAAQWPKQRIPRDKVIGSGGSGWFNVGDWFNGEWKDADVEMKPDGAVWTYTFNPANAVEYPDVADFDVRFRSTLKLRLLFPGKAPQVAAFSAFTDSVWHQTSALVEWGGNADTEQKWDGKVEVFNGHVSKVQPRSGGKVAVSNDAWTSTVKGSTDGVVLDIWYAKPVPFHSFDDTIVTIRSAQHDFSFLAKEVTEGKRIFVREYGALVQCAKDPVSYGEVEQAYQKNERTLFDQIAALPEQTLPRAWSDMPRKGRIYMPLAVEGGRQHFGILPNGDIRMDRRWNDRIQGEDSPKAKWNCGNMYLTFGLPHGSKTGASREEGDLPTAVTWYEKDNVRYEQLAFATTLNGILPPEGRVKGTEPQVLMLRFKLTNVGDQPASAELPIGAAMHEGGKSTPEPVITRDGFVYSNLPDEELLRMYFNLNNEAKLEQDGETVLCKIEIPARSIRTFYVHVPFQTVLDAAETEQLKKLDFDDQHKMITSYWRKRISEGAQIHTPEWMINDFYSAHASHLLINSENEVGAPNNHHVMVKVGTFGYGAFTNESVMMTVDMNRRGYNAEVEGAMRTWLDYQGTVPFPGDYSATDSMFYGANGYEDGGYNQHHGWTLWGMAEHYWFTRDKEWLQSAAPKLIKGCDWIISERSRTKTDECVGLRAIEYGLMPQGSLEDIADWRTWMSNNDFNYWGMENVARALVDIGHPDGNRLAKEAEDYRQDIRNAFFEAMARSPVVALRDGSYVPSIPSDVHRRGRSFGWITETLEGSIYLLRTGVIAPDEPIAKWIMQDYEDNRYLSDSYGYQIPFFERDWFSLGGFSQQPNLLCSPVPYLLRDEIKHYIRAYFNAFAAGYFPERGMITEHPLPNLGDYAGDHFKSSDEALNTSWLRWMFIFDELDDLYLGKAIPRYWLMDGQEIKIERAQTHFGEMGLTLKSNAKSGSIEMTIDPPTRNLPPMTYARFRHPDEKSMNRVTVNGKEWTDFDPAKEWVVLPALTEKTVVTAYYD